MFSKSLTKALLENFFKLLFPLLIKISFSGLEFINLSILLANS